MKFATFVLNTARNYWYLVLTSVIITLASGFSVLSGLLEQHLILKYFISLISGICAGVNTLLFICLIGKWIKDRGFLKDKWRNTTISTSVGAVYNTAYVIIALFSAYFLQSSWYLIFGLYHLTFAIVRQYLGHGLRTKEESKNPWFSYRFSAYFILVSAFIFHIMVIFVTHDGEPIRARYPFLLYLIALATFINIITAVSNLIRIRKFHSPQIKASKNISFASSLFSLFFLQNMMLNEYSQNTTAQFIRIMNIGLGSTVFGILVLLGTYMLIRSRKSKVEQTALSQEN